MPVGPEHRLTNPPELLFRQASRGWMREGRPSTQLFRARVVDHGMVSVDREQVVGTAAASFDAAKERGFKTVGVWAVSVAEINGESLDGYGDPSKDNPAHALIDMSSSSDADQLAIADRLHDFAIQRGQQA